jgi:hypothetical protein
MLAFVCFVVVVVGAVVVQPTTATIHTPKTSGINFFIVLFYQNTSDLSLRWSGLGRSTYSLMS